MPQAVSIQNFSLAEKLDFPKLGQGRGLGLPGGKGIAMRLIRESRIDGTFEGYGGGRVEPLCFPWPDGVGQEGERQLRRARSAVSPLEAVRRVVAEVEPHGEPWRSSPSSREATC